MSTPVISDWVIDYAQFTLGVAGPVLLITMCTAFWMAVLWVLIGFACIIFECLGWKK